VSGQLNAPPLYSWNKCPRYPSKRRLGAPKGRSESFVEETNLITLSRIKPRFLCCSARSLRHYNDYITRALQLSENISSSFVNETWQLRTWRSVRRPKNLSQATMHLTCNRKVLVLNTGYPNLLVVSLSSPGNFWDHSTTKPWLLPQPFQFIFTKHSLKYNLRYE
jgi:hypothetical protein